jgi:Zn-dependent peptidase ImmA (M78 family)
MISAIKGELETKAERTLRDTETYRLPVPIILVAERLHLVVEPLDLGPHLSGVLIASTDGARIGYNSSHARVRQRLTVAHELAHYLLHTSRNGKPELFVDRRILDRHNETMSLQVEQREQEANQLGAALLMPKEFLQNEIIDQNLDLDDDEAIRQLGRRFLVSAAMIALRLMALGISH